MARRELTWVGRLGVVHVHSDYSHDGRDPLVALRGWAEAKGIGFVGLTDHAEDFDPEIFRRYVEDCARASSRSVTLIPGLEFRFAGYPGLHLLALGLRRWMEPVTPAMFIRDAADVAEFTIVAHPVLSGYSLPEEVRSGIHAVEVWNTAYNTRYLPDPRAVRLLQEIGRERPEVVGIIGLDQHDSSNDRQARVFLLGPGTDPLKELRAGRFVNQGRTMRFASRLRWSPVRLAVFTILRWVYDRFERVQERLARHSARGA